MPAPWGASLVGGLPAFTCRGGPEGGADSLELSPGPWGEEAGLRVAALTPLTGGKWGPCLGDQSAPWTWQAPPPSAGSTHLLRRPVQRPTQRGGGAGPEGNACRRQDLSLVPSPTLATQLPGGQRSS